MFLPQLKYRKLANPVTTKSFGGLNRSESITDNEFSDMKNVGGRKYPFISSALPRKTIYSPDGKIEFALPLLYGEGEMSADEFCGIIDGYFYYKSKKKSSLSKKLMFPYPYSDPVKYPQFGGKEYPYSVVPFNGTYIIFPSLMIYDPATDTLKALVEPRIMDYVEFYSSVSRDTGKPTYVTIRSPMCDNSSLSEYYKSQHFGFLTDKNVIKAGDRITVWYDVEADDNPSYNNTTVDTSSPELKNILTSAKSVRPCTCVRVKKNII